MFPVIQIGPLSIQSAGLFLLAGYYFALIVTGKAVRAAGLDTGKVENTILFSTAAGLAGARLGFLLQNPEIFWNNWVSIFSLNGSLLDLSSGFLLALVTGALLLKKYQIPLEKFLDGISWGVIIQTIGVLFSNYASGNELGTATGAAWGVQIAGSVRHPVQIYEILSITVLVLFGWYFTDRKKISLPNGVLFFLSTSILTFSLLAMNIFHESSNWIFSVRSQQVTYLLILAVSLVTMDWLFSKNALGSKE